MADLAALEQRFEGISVQDENVDTNAPKQHKAKVRISIIRIISCL